MPDIACLNGTITPLNDAKVSVNDRGFLFGDGVYEVIRTYGSRPFRLEAHLDRLYQSLSQVRIVPNWERATLTAWIDAVLARAGHAETKIYVQVTRGVAPRNHPFPPVPPTTLVTATEIHPLPADVVRAGVAAISMPDIRWARCDVKSLNLLPNVLARQAALDAGAFEALFVGDGVVREGSSSNVFGVIGGALVTPPLGPRLLPGVSRAYLLEVARDLGLTVHERDLSLAELQAADEVFLTGTTIEVLGVTRIDGATIGNGTVGPVTRRLAARFRPAARAAG
ncbi:MAG: D-amino acid aminotransferase [Nitrospirae bacterium]|nr:D-amino acid aminotransferase [Nitrospirota bacterium]